MRDRRPARETLGVFHHVGTRRTRCAIGIGLLGDAFEQLGCIDALDLRDRFHRLHGDRPQVRARAVPRLLEVYLLAALPGKADRHHKAHDARDQKAHRKARICLELFSVGVDDLSHAVDDDRMDALHDLLMQVRQRRPNAEGVLPDNGQVFPFPELDPLGDTFGVLTEESGTTVVNWYAADAYNRLCRTMHQWYQEGLILRNASLRDEPATDRMRLGNSFGFFARLNRDSLDCYTRACGTELTAIPLGPTIQNGSIPVESWCLPVTNSHRREALALLELLYTDASCYDLFAKGDGKEEQFHPWQNLYLNASGLLPETDEQPQWVSPAYGFSFNNSAVAAKLDACRALKNSYHNGLMCGYLDSEEALPEFLEKLEQAGIQEILQAKQSALDNWLNALH